MFKVTHRPKRALPAPEIDPKPYKRREVKKRICVLDSETDPFDIDPATSKARNVKPFTCGFFDGETYVDFWGPRCFDLFFEYLDRERSSEQLMIVAHNGGNFDFHFFLDRMDEGTSPFIMDGRIVRMECHGQEFRDSYKLIPVALSEFQKDEIDYWLFETWEVCDIRTREVVQVRDLYRAEILHYQRKDCEYLHELVSAAYDEFGDKLTMASVALPMLRSFHGFDTMGESIDADLRPFYFGGRCEAFEVGELRPREPDGRWIIVDVNSMYPFVMANCKHPISTIPEYEKRITERTHFARIFATSRGALPVRLDNGGLAFPHERRTFYASIHEIRAAQELGLLDIHRVDYSIYFRAEATFDEFVGTFYKRRLEADEAGDKIRKLFWKLVLNSSYGKFAQDPRKYEQFEFDPPTHPLPLRCFTCNERELRDNPGCGCDGCAWGISHPSGWSPHTTRNGRIIYARPQTRLRNSGFFNVATAASITAAARAQLLRGIASADRPVYCDTDSLICERFGGEVDSKRLGAWKVEAEGDLVGIAGKKLYAVFNGGVEVKKASKGVRLTAEQIARVARGETVVYASPVPKFNLDGTFTTTERTIQRTVA